MANWVVMAKKADFNRLAEKFNISPMVARIIRNRDMIEEKEIEKFLYGTLEDLYPPEQMKDMVKGAEIVKDKIREKQKIRIIGDYDIDGVCATYILRKGLLICGAQVDFAIPHRIYDGYGLNEHLIQQAYEDGIDTIITCDNGIAACEQIEKAKELGMTVLITDHHEIPFSEGQNGEKKYQIPPAVAVIDPRQEDCPYPYKEICGAVVAYKFIQCLMTKMGVETHLLNELLEFAAIATVGDVMPLLDENRIIVKYGLAAIRKTKNIGLKALLTVNGLEEKDLSPYHIGYVLGPCLNATGRLDTAARALDLFDTEEPADAAVIAGDLKALNDSRKDMTAKGVELAIDQLEHTGHKNDTVLVVYLPECHESLAGIIAGRIREKYGKPTFIFTDGEEGVKGSGRSIEAYHMYEALSRHKELFTKFGGHKMAAGLSLISNNVETFRHCMNADSNLTPKDFQEKIQIDIPMPMRFANLDFINELSLLEPFGTGNAKPIFAQKNVHFLSGRILGKNRNVGKYVVEDEQQNRFDVIYFGDIQAFDAYISEQYGLEQKHSLYEGKKTKISLSICYYPDINEYRGMKNIQIVMKDFQ
ncbi:MAG: single-stranded-DNA-specific exonuclease RecJ [Lachnospiraceae bacterium]|nr:single-stranded-DNA-specific exonuclease RecJ [Lachnospiraceae bacterium]